MTVLNWMQTRFHGAQCSKNASEFSAGSAPPVADTCSEPRRREDELQGGWPAVEAMLSMGTFGEGHLEELEKLQEELTLLMRAKGTEDEDKMRHLPLKRSLNEGIAKQKSLRKLVSSVFNGFLPRPSFRETMHESRATENPWLLINEGTHAGGNPVSSKAVIKSDLKAQMRWRGDVYGEADEQGSKWIRTDSEYIVLEI